MSGPSKDLETASQRSANPWALDFDTDLHELNLELQSPKRAASPTEIPILTAPEPVPTSPPEAAVVPPSKPVTVTVPEPALIFSPPHTVASSIRSIRPPSALYFCRYSEDGDHSDASSHLSREADRIEGYRVFREKDLVRNSRADVSEAHSPPSEKDTQKNGERLSENDSSPAITITPSDYNANGGFLKEGMTSTETVIRNPRRVSRFTEVMSSSEDESSQESSTVIEEKIDTTENMPRSDKILYIHAPWILRFIYIFILSNWWSLIPLMKVSSTGFHPENLPIFYSTAMLAIVIINLSLQASYFRTHGPPWGHRRRVEKIREAAEKRRMSRRLDLPFGTFVGRNDPGPCPGVDLESNRNPSRVTLKKDRNRRKWRMRTGMESYVFAVDLILFMLTLAILGVSIVVARHGSIMHEVQMAEAAAGINGTLSGVPAAGQQNTMAELYGDDDGYKLRL